MFWKYQMRRMIEYIVLMIMVMALPTPAIAITYINCSTKKVVIVSDPSGEASSTREEEFAFVADEATRTLVFSDSRRLTVTRLDKHWISADRDGIFYEFNRQDGTLSFASATTQDGVTTTIVGAGQCVFSRVPIE